MKNSTKTKVFIFTPIAVILAALITFFVIDRFFWTHFDYYFCANPKSGLSYQGIDVQDNKVNVYFYPVTNFTHLWGYDYYVEEDVLYMGIKTVTFGGESFDIPTILSAETNQKVSKVILKGAGMEWTVYENGKSKNYNGEWIN